MSGFDKVYNKYLKYKKQYQEHVIKRLKKTNNPHQVNDFNFLTIPEGHPDAGLEVPVDFLLQNLVLYFWKNDFITEGVDQGWDIATCFSPAFITFNYKLKSGQDSDVLLKHIRIKTFGKDNILIINDREKTFDVT